MTRPEVALRSGERLLWSGSPDPAVAFTRGDVFLIPFSILWAAFALFWEASVLSRPGPPVLFPIFGAVFVVFGLYFVIGRFFVKAWRKRRTTYAITDRRAISIVGERSSEIALPVTGVVVDRHREHADVAFGGVVPRRSWGFGQQASGIYRNTGLDFFDRGDPGAVRFFDVADVSGLDAALDRVRES
jgi:hypothetical protein